MLNQIGFDLWADGYDASIARSDAEDRYPFAGYKKLLTAIYAAVQQAPGIRVLDLGVGTGVLAQRLYADGYTITGVDFSPRMLSLAGEKMPGARLFLHDFSTGLPPALAGETFDHILCTYAIHHLTPSKQIALLRELTGHLMPGGQLLLGDIAFADRAALNRCRARAGSEWDDEEYYPVAQELQLYFPKLYFEAYSHCCGVFRLQIPEQTPEQLP